MSLNGQEVYIYIIQNIYSGWSSGAMVLGNFQCPANMDYGRAGPTA